MAEVLGGFEHKVLLAMMRLDASAYSVPIVRELEEQTGRPRDSRLATRDS